jgi:L-aspartate oxidase
VARAVAETDAAGGAFLDARAITDFAAQFPGIHAMLRGVGLDPARDLLPVAAALHYAMGGVSTDLEGHTSRAGLWAAGEVACTGVHGANRLASNSLLEGLVFSDRVAREVADERPGGGIPDHIATSEADADTGADAAFAAVRQEMREIMTRGVGVVRTEASLADAQAGLARLEAATPAAAWRTHRQLSVAQLITRSARGRRESRGGHRRADFPPRPSRQPL